MSLCVLLLEAWRKMSLQYVTFSAIIRTEEGNGQEEEKKEEGREEKSLWLWVWLCAKAAP